MKRRTMIPALLVAVSLLAAVPTVAFPRLRARAAPTSRADDGPASLSVAASRMMVPEGFKVTLFAGEPDVRQPIAFTMDDRGRLWIVESYSYPNWMPGAVRGQDRVVIFEDEDGDGRFDHRTVFWDKGDNLTGIELGFGGVWLCATPNLLFIPKKEDQDTPAGEPRVVLDGWDENCKHNAFNALTWGPEGWLYGCNGILSNSKVGRPGTPESERVPINCGVWRYHPTKGIFEVVANGTTNPWGLDFNDTGEMFITNCVIPHLFHVVPGAHFQRMYGQDFNPHLYDLMTSCADHIHWGGGDWTSSRGGQGIHSEAGGGHAHAGAMIYLADNWPERYRHSIFMLNIHGQRVNHDRLTRSHSGFIATHEKDFLLADDPWFRGLELKYGPDGAVYMTDWSDIGECHDYDSLDGVHRETGRVYRISFGEPKRTRIHLADLSDADLETLQSDPNDWYVRHARRLLQERAAAGKDMAEVHRLLEELFRTHDDVSGKLRAIWALHVTGGLSAAALYQLLADESEYVRAWAVRLSCEDRAPLDNSAGSNFLGKFVQMSVEDPSPFVRLYLAAALQRIPLGQRWPIAGGLVNQSEDADDTNLALMAWYGIEPLASVDCATAAALAGRAKIPLIRRFLARRIVLEPDAEGTNAPAAAGLASLIQVIKTTRDTATQLDLLRGIHDALRGQKNLPMPRGWPSLSEKLTASPDVHDLALAIGLVFGDPNSAASLKRTMTDRGASPDTRQRAIQSLVEGGISNIVQELVGLLDDPAVRGAAIRALAAFDDAATPRRLLDRYADLTDPERADAIATLASRPGYARALLAGIAAGTIPARDVSPFIARQVQGFGVKEINEKLNELWGTLRPASAERLAVMAQYKAQLTPDRLARADPVRGRGIFNRTCAQCHRLFGEGNDVGPDLTGSNRGSVDFILENVLDPNAVVGRDYKLTIIATKNGRVISGIIRERTDTALVIQTANERVTLAIGDIEAMTESPASMMPEGILEKLSVEEVRDLVAYLAAKSQVDLPQK